MPFTQIGLPYARGSHTSYQAAEVARRTIGKKTAAYVEAVTASGAPA